MNGRIDSIETFGLVDGPGIRTVIFTSGCKLRCLFCHNPETWKMGNPNYTPEEVVAKIVRNKPYFGDKGGVTFSGGEPLLQPEFLIETCKLLKKENIHIALDTAGCGLGNYDELLSLIDLVILDIKAIDIENYQKMTKHGMKEFNEFIECLNRLNKKLWLRQVIVPGINDNTEYMYKLKEYIKRFNNVERVELLPYHGHAITKYQELGIDYPLKDVPDLTNEKKKELEKILFD